MHPPQLLLLASSLIAALTTDASPAPHHHLSIEIHIDDSSTTNNGAPLIRPQDSPSLSADFDCSDKQDGDYANPLDCTTFYTCDNEVAYLMPCGDCTIDEKRCPNGKLNFSEKNRLVDCENHGFAECLILS